jgi:hypothetical protein
MTDKRLESAVAGMLAEINRELNVRSLNDTAAILGGNSYAIPPRGQPATAAMLLEQIRRYGAQTRTERVINAIGDAWAACLVGRAFDLEELGRKLPEYDVRRSNDPDEPDTISIVLKTTKEEIDRGPMRGDFFIINLKDGTILYFDPKEQ